MDADVEIAEKVYSLLLPAVRQGDIECLKRYLSTIQNPDEYLNQVYDEEGMQKCTLLTIACLNGHDDVMNMLIDYYKPDLEIKNNILFGDESKKQQMCIGVTVLWVAAAMNNFQIVKLLVEHGADVNHTTKTNSTPLRSACYNGNIDIARYLIKNGADVKIAKENNDTNLAVSVYRKHLPMATYLVDELGCDVNVCDNDGRSPLYDAVNGGSLELVNFLLDHGARNFRAKSDQMSPLMWAAEKRQVDLMKAIASRCSVIEQIEAEELIASAFACTDIEGRDFVQSFEHFTQALELRCLHNLPKQLRITMKNDLFDHRQECQTLEQLKEFQSNHSSLCIEALLARERLLGPNNSEYRYSLRYYGAILADDDQHNQAIAFWMYELRLRQEYSIDIDPENLRHFASMFSEMVFLSLSIPIDALLTVIKVTAGELKHDTSDFDFNLYTLLFLITIISQFFTKMNISIDDRREIYRFIYSINQYQYVTRLNGSSLLHLTVNDKTSADDYFIDRTCKYPCPLTVRTLIQCGANVNATDNILNTPLHVFVSSRVVCDENILNFLCEHDAHLDCVNVLRESATDLADNVNTIQLLKSKMKLNLKCLCAQLIQKNNVSFHGRIAKSLAQFVEKH